MYDVAVLGAGPGGYVAALRAAQLGAHTLLVERSYLGGTCLNWGCIPSKTMLASAELLLKSRKFKNLGLSIDGKVSLDWHAVVDRKNKVVQTLRSGVDMLLKKNKVELKRGYGRLSSLTSISITGDNGGKEEIAANKIIIATGSFPTEIPEFNIDRKTIITTNEVFDLQDLPETMIIVGAGVNGCELSTLFSIFGVKVILIELLPSLLQLTPIPQSIRQRMATNLKRLGVHIVTDARISSLKVEEGHAVTHLDDEGQFQAERAVVTIGRRLNTLNIGLQEVGIDFGPRDSILVNEFMQTSHPDVYAIGDITGNLQLAHLASRQGILASEHAMHRPHVAPLNYNHIPACVFTDPPVAYVGPGEVELREQNIDFDVFEFPYRVLGIARAKDTLEGSVWMFAEQKSRTILSGGVYGYGAPELIHIIAIGVANNLTVEQMMRVVFAHPTFAEGIGECLEGFGYGPINI